MVATASTVLAAGGEGHHVDSGVLLKDFLYRLFNFAVTFGLLAYFVTKPIRKGLSGRKEGIEKSLAEAKAAQEKAEAKFAEYDDKLTKASAEIDDIYAAIKREGELERERILANAREMALKIEEEAKKSAALEVAKARIELQREASDMALKVAEELLKKNFNSNDQNRLVDEYMKKVGELH
ncbi:ATP synthase F0 subunit B [Desulfuromonas acetexigens]|uniref:ATP synthase subunit b n=2 Tax=Trichloromonas acetexigens TaxID=38815 RepID=A0A550J5L1_9BACT|nr:ATP synthase F0 subunit B [Desulfuromonas acetexigens]